MVGRVAFLSVSGALEVRHVAFSSRIMSLTNAGRNFCNYQYILPKQYLLAMMVSPGLNKIYEIRLSCDHKTVTSLFWMQPHRF